MKNKKIFKIVIVITILIIIGVVISLYFYKYRLKDTSKIISGEQTNKTSNNILTNVIKSSNFNIRNSKIYRYKITNMKELNTFYSFIDYGFMQESDDIVKEFLNEFKIKDEDFEENTVFIKYQEEGSGRVMNDFIGVELKNRKVDFIIDRDASDGYTEDMAFWYFITIIPNKDLEGIYTEEWSVPTKIEIEHNF